MKCTPAAIRLIQILLLLVFGGCAQRPTWRVTQKTTFRIPDSVRPGPQEPIEGAIPGVENFGMVSKDVWRGGKPSAEGLHTLAALGVKTVIDLREADESADIPHGVRYVRLPVSAWQADQVDVEQVLKMIAASPKPVFIHCHQGRDRTGLAIAAYRLSLGMSAADACRELRNFQVNPWWDAPIERRIYSLEQQRILLDRRRLVESHKIENPQASVSNSR
jgi:protein tyrosine phosphatase (PTP) superfamily phosphohydrolase (DUF442 family)